MRVFILGGTGTIGQAVSRAVPFAGHQLSALSRSARSDSWLRGIGAMPVRGDLKDPGGWADALADADAVIQVAATFDQDMGTVDAGVVRAIRSVASKRARPLRVLYTGGCWLYGQTGKRVAEDNARFDPLPSFAWMVDHAEALLNDPKLSVAVLHPGIVYCREGGAFDRFKAQAQGVEPIEVWGDPTTRWPLVHRDDLANAYLGLLEREDLTGHFNVAAQTGVPVADIVTVFARVFIHSAGTELLPYARAIEMHGEMAEGPMLDQQMSSTRIRDALGWRPNHGCVTRWIEGEFDTSRSFED